MSGDIEYRGHAVPPSGNGNFHVRDSIQFLCRAAVTDSTFMPNDNTIANSARNNLRTWSLDLAWKTAPSIAGLANCKPCGLLRCILPLDPTAASAELAPLQRHLRSVDHGGHLRGGREPAIQSAHPACLPEPAVGDSDQSRPPQMTDDRRTLGRARGARIHKLAPSLPTADKDQVHEHPA